MAVGVVQMKLKTLKDLKENINGTVSKKLLMEEAIKYLKIQMIQMNVSPDVYAWVKWFFNITEEDLK